MNKRIGVLAAWVAIATLLSWNCATSQAASRSVKAWDDWYRAAQREVRGWHADQRNLLREAHVARIKQLNLEQAATIGRLRGSEIGRAVREFSAHRRAEYDHYRQLRDALRCATKDRLERLESRYLGHRRHLVMSSPYVPASSRYGPPTDRGRHPPVAWDWRKAASHTLGAYVTHSAVAGR